jgi:condensin complex subunit 1
MQGNNAGVIKYLIYFILFAHVIDVKQWEYIAYCLSQLTLTERGLKKLIESFKAYEHALSEDSVLNHFRSIIAKVSCHSKNL